jgi:hypothetical protein
LHNEELHNLFSSPNIIRMFKPRKWIWAGHVARMGRKRNEYRILVGKPEGKRPLGRPRRRWVDNSKMALRETRLGGVAWIDIAHDRDQWGVSFEHGNESSGSIKCWEVLGQLHNWQLLKKGSAP